MEGAVGEGGGGEGEGEESAVDGEGGEGPDVWFYQILCIDELLSWRIALIGC